MTPDALAIGAEGRDSKISIDGGSVSGLGALKLENGASTGAVVTVSDSSVTPVDSFSLKAGQVLPASLDVQGVRI